MANVRLRDALVWYSARLHAPRDDTANWLNQAKHLVGSPMVPTGGMGFATGGVLGPRWFHLAGVGQYLQVDHHAALDPTLTSGFTVYYHGQFTAASDSDALLIGKKGSHTSAASKGWALYRNAATSQVRLGVADGTTQHVVTSGSIGYSTDFVAAITYSGPSTSKLYVDGVLIGTDSTALVANPAAGGSIDLFLGRIGNTDDYQPYGNVYDVAVFRGAHTATEVAQVSTDLVTPPAELVIGRTVFFDSLASPVMRGDEFTFDADIYPDTVDEAKVMRQQLMALLPGEAVNVTWSEDPDMDGFYAVDSVDVAPVPVYLSTGLMPVKVKLVKLPGGGVLTQEVSVTMAIRDAVALTTQTAGWVGFPSRARWVDRRVTSSTSVLVARGAGSVIGAQPEPDAGTPVWNSVTGPLSQAGLYLLPPDAMFDAAAGVEYKADDDEWYALHGTQLPTRFVTDPLRVRVTTGLFRVRWTNTWGHLQASIYTDHGWETPTTTFDFSTAASGAAPYKDHQFAPQTVSVDRNDPWTTVVTFRGIMSPYGEEPLAAVGVGSLQPPFLSAATLTVTARRGTPHVGFTFTSDYYARRRFGPTAHVASTYVDATKSRGMYQTTVDSENNRHVIDALAADAAATTAWHLTRGDVNILEPVHGTIAATVKNPSQFMLGIEDDDDAAGLAPYGLACEWWIATDETHRVILP